MSENSLQECSMLATTDSCISLELVKNKFTSVVEGITKVFEKEIINRQAKT